VEGVSRWPAAIVAGILGCLARVVIFLVVGPIIGGMLFVVAALANVGDIKGVVLGSFVTMVLAFPLFLVGCYVMGAKAALAAGFVLALIGPWIRPRPLLLVVSALVGTAATLLLASDGNEKSGSTVLLAFVGAASAAACAWLLDRMDLMRLRRASAA